MAAPQRVVPTSTMSNAGISATWRQVYTSSVESQRKVASGADSTVRECSPGHALTAAVLIQPHSPSSALYRRLKIVSMFVPTGTVRRRFQALKGLIHVGTPLEAT